jgi:hypothetical protein
VKIDGDFFSIRFDSKALGQTWVTKKKILRSFLPLSAEELEAE